MDEKRKRIWSVTAVAMIAVLCSQSAFATSSSQFQNQKEEIQNQVGQNQEHLNEINEQIGELSGEKQSIEEEIAELNNEIAEIMASITVLEEDIAAKEAEIEQAKLDLEAAIQKENEQYEAMKIRIQFMYEKGDATYVSLLLEAGSFSDMLTKADYIEKLYEYDRKLLTEYQDTKNQVAQMKIDLENEESELLAAKDECIAEQAELETAVNEMETMVSDYAAQIASAKKQANTYVAAIKQQNAQIKKLEQQRLAALAKEQAAASGGGNSYTNVTGTKYTGSAYSIDTSIITNANGSDKGKQIAQYGCQFLGNPYVAGGTSLTNGADCSGFTSAVYANFGITLPRTSYSQRSVGTEVSYENAQPGDIICYAGHVAIYVGGGLIVHASSAKTGIKITNATYRSIITIRRVV